MLLPSLEALPLELRSPRAFHLGVHPEHPPLELMRALRQNLGPDGILSVETFTKAEAPLSDGDLKAVVSLSTIFSPNEEEALSMLNRMQHSIDELKLDRQPWLMTTPFIQAGAGWVVIRRGPKGAVVHDAATDSLWDVPAVSNLNVRDFTGCGNAFCGAFLAAVQAGSPGGEAAAWGCAAGSAMAEARGVPWVPVRDTAPLIRSRAENLIAKKLVRR